MKKVSFKQPTQFPIKQTKHVSSNQNQNQNQNGPVELEANPVRMEEVHRMEKVHAVEPRSYFSEDSSEEDSGEEERWGTREARRNSYGWLS